MMHIALKMVQFMLMMTVLAGRLCNTFSYGWEGVQIAALDSVFQTENVLSNLCQLNTFSC